jgi:hypothetical protein
MSVQVRTGPSTDIWTIDATPKAGRVIIYNAAGAALSVTPKATISARTLPLVYRYVLADKAGGAGGTSFVALYNPVASGKTLALLSAEVQIYGATFTSATKNSLRMYRINAAPTGGVDDTANIARLLSSQSAPVATVTITGPTLSNLTLLKGFGAGGQTGSAAGIYSTYETRYRPDQEDYQFLAQSGFGFSLHQTTAGTADQIYSFTLEWMEYTP